MIEGAVETQKSVISPPPLYTYENVFVGVCRHMLTGRACVYHDSGYIPLCLLVVLSNISMASSTCENKAKSG